MSAMVYAPYVLVGLVWLACMVIATDPPWERRALRPALACPGCGTTSRLMTSGRKAACLDWECRIVTWDPGRRR